MSLKLSYTQLNTYQQCGQKYYLHYVKRKRNKYHHAALAFGSAIDNGLNTLLLTKDLQKSIDEFEKTWNFQWVNGKTISLSRAPEVVYADADCDLDLLQLEDEDNINKEAAELFDNQDGAVVFAGIVEKKDQVGYDKLLLNEKKLFNYVNWLCLRRKGHIMLHSYNEKVIPKILRVLAVQHKTELINTAGDAVTQVLDFIVEWEDGSVVLMDNKTSAREYEPDSAGRSQQLLSYYFQSKDEFNLGAVGYAVLQKNIKKNKKKTCLKCKAVAEEGSRVKTCAIETEPGVKKSRCNGEFQVEMNPECIINIIINPVDENSIGLVLDSFDDATEGIKREYWYRNLGACKQGSIICAFYKNCWKNSEEDIIDLNEVKKS
jgi:hypothetical protein